MHESEGYQIIVLVVDALDFGLAPAGEPEVDMFALAVVGKFMDAVAPRALDDGDVFHSHLFAHAAQNFPLLLLDFAAVAGRKTKASIFYIQI